MRVKQLLVPAGAIILFNNRVDIVIDAFLVVITRYLHLHYEAVAIGFIERRPLLFLLLIRCGGLFRVR